MAPPVPLPLDWFVRARLKLRHLQLLGALDERRHLARAAASLSITQPAASKLLAEIEAMLGTVLFERLPRGMQPNRYGEVLIRRARSVLIELEAAGRELDALQAGAAGQVTIGAVTGPASGSVLRAVEQMRLARPGMAITVQVETSGPLVARLLEGRLDFAVARIPPGIEAAGLAYRQLADEEISLFVREGHGLLRRRPLTLASLAGLPWVLQPPGTLLRRRIDGLFRAAGLAPPVEVLNTDSVMLSLSIVARGAAVTALSRVVVETLAGPRGLFRRLPELPETGRIAIEPYGLIRLSDRPLSPAAQALYHAVEAEQAAERPEHRRGDGPGSGAAGPGGSRARPSPAPSGHPVRHR